MDNEWHKLSELTDEEKIVLEGIYKFLDLQTNKEKLYVGQSKNILKRLFQHIFGHKLDMKDLYDTDVKQVKGGTEAREKAEQDTLNELSANKEPVSNQKKAVTNKRMQEIINKMNGDETD